MNFCAKSNQSKDNEKFQFVMYQIIKCKERFHFSHGVAHLLGRLGVWSEDISKPVISLSRPHKSRSNFDKQRPNVTTSRHKERPKNGDSRKEEPKKQRRAHHNEARPSHCRSNVVKLHRSGSG